MNSKKGFEVSTTYRDNSEKNNPKIINSKKGQVTIFIIIGILLLFIFAAIFFVTKVNITEKFTTEGEPIITQAPLEFKPIQTYTENCLRQIGKRGLLILGEQGGYIYPDLMGEYSVSDPTNSKGLNLEPLKVPYWHYNSEPNKASKVSLASLQPKLHHEDDLEMSVEAQLARFVEERLDACLDGYSPFVRQAFEIEMADIGKTEVQVTNYNVNFWLKMDVEVSQGESQHEFDQFFVKIPLELKRYYEVANQITEAERNFTFLENQALDLIQVYSALDSEKLPPTSAQTFEMFPTVFWNTPDVESKLQGLLTAYVPMLRYLSSNNFYRYDYPVSDLSSLYQKNYDNMILPLEGGEGLEINFDFFDWPIYFDVNSIGDNLQPNSLVVHFMFLHFGSQTYNTVYDVSYPVLVTVHDPQAFDGEGYNFVVALESNIRNNKAAEHEKEAPQPLVTRMKSMACNRDKYNTELVKTIVVDASTGDPMEAVQIGLSIPNQDDCIIGMTDQHGELESKYPAVYGGVASFIKPDYLVDFYPIDTYKYKEQPGIIGYAAAGYPEEVIEMYPYKSINVGVKKKNLEKCILGMPYVDIPGEFSTPFSALTLGLGGYLSEGAESVTHDVCFSNSMLGNTQDPLHSYSPEALSTTHIWTYSGVTRSLKETEQAIITLTRVDDRRERILSEEFTETIFVNGEETQSVRVVPGIYEVSGNLILEEEVIFPEEERCTSGVLESIGCRDIDGCCSTIDETIMEVFPNGQLEWNTQETYLEITPEQLYGSENLEFYIPSPNIENVPQRPHIRIVEDMQIMAEMGRISQELRNQLKPSFG